MLLGTSTKGNFSGLLGQAFDRLGAASRAKAWLKVLLHLSRTERKADGSSARWHVHSEGWGCFQSFHCTLHGDADRNQQGASRWERGELAGAQRGARPRGRLGPRFLAKGAKGMRADLVSF